jgi:3-dehydroquinate synthase class II
MVENSEPLPGQTFLQTVDTVRLVSVDGDPVSTLDLTVGMRVLIFSQEAGARHKGEITDGVAWER